MNCEEHEVPFTPEQREQYYKALKESDGFDVPHFNHPGLLLPISDSELKKDIFDRFGGLAIQHYNHQNGTDFEAVELVKVNSQLVADYLYYITFKAKPIGSLTDDLVPATTFQARVYDCSFDPEESEVCFCRIAKTSHPSHK